MKNARFILLLLLFPLLLSACASHFASNEENDTLCITDALGRTVSVPKQPTRVAALTGSFADVWTLAGGTLCATANDAWEDFDLPLSGVTDIGGAHSPSLELLIASEPDLVIASASNASNVKMQAALEDVGIPVLYFDVDNFSDYLHMLDICTDITCRKDLYEQNGLQIQAEIKQIKTAFTNDPIPPKMRTVLLLRASSTSVKAKGSEGTVLGEMLKDLGCVNIADSDRTLLETLSVESVMQAEPYRIFIISMGNDPAAARAAVETMMKENAAWNSLEAVKEGRIHMMDRSLFNLKPNARWALAYEELSEILQ